MRYCGGINSLVKRMLDYEIPKAKKGKESGINVNFDRVIVDLASEAKRIKNIISYRKKKTPKDKTVDELEKNVQELSKKVKKMREDLQKIKGPAALIPRGSQRLALAENELKQAKLMLKRRMNKKELGKDISEEGIQARIKYMIENPVQTFDALTAIEKEKVIKESNFDAKLKLTQGKGITTTSLLQSGPGTTVRVQHRGNPDTAVVVSVPRGAELISQNVLKKMIQNNPLAATPQEFGDIIHGVGGLRQVTKGSKQQILEDVFNLKNKAFVDRFSSSFKEIVNDLNSSHEVVSGRIERRKNRRSEEFTRKMKVSPLTFINQSINKTDESLLKYMYKELVYKMEATKQFIDKKKKMPNSPCEYFDVLYNHFIGFSVQNGKKIGANDQCNSSNIKKLYTIFKTSKNIQDVLKSMFNTDRKLREVYQYAADDYFHDGSLNVSSCASKFLLLGRSRYVAINPSVLDKIRDKKISKEINKYNSVISKLNTEINRIKKQMAEREMNLKEEKDPARITRFEKVLKDAREELKAAEKEAIKISMKRNRYIKLRLSASKGKITHIYLNKDQKWTKNAATDGKLQGMVNNTLYQTAKEPLSINSIKGNSTIFKQTTLLMNYIAYLIAPESTPKAKNAKAKGKKSRQSRSS